MGITDVTGEALAEYDRLGQTVFLDRHGSGEAPRYYYLAFNGRRYDSKAVVGVAHGTPDPTWEISDLQISATVSPRWRPFSHASASRSL